MENMKISEALEKSRLDEHQRRFCGAVTRSVRLLAPAGSGKTYSLLWRCLNHFDVATGDKPRFLIFTFTRAARDELKDRLKTDPDFKRVEPSVEITTLNSWGFRRLKLRMHSPRLLTSGKDFYFCVNNTLQPVWDKHDKIRTVVTTAKAKNRVAKTIMELMDYLKALGFRHDVHHDFKCFSEHLKVLADAGLVAHVQALATMMEDIEIIPTGGKNPIEAMHTNFVKFWCEACQHMFSTSTITLEDQKYWAYIEVDKASKENRFTTGIHRFDHVLVDEFQDINQLDLNLLKSIAASNKAELTIVGDDDQAIYEWRGTSPEFVIKPERHIAPNYATFILENNYRSPRNIVELSQKLIKHNKRRVDKSIKPVSKTDADIRVISMPSLGNTLEYVLAEVRRLLKSPEIKNVALIGRKRSQIIPYQITFARENIPFYAAEDLHVFLSSAFTELKEMLAVKARASSGPIPGFDPIVDLLKLCDKVKRFPLNQNDRQHLNRHLQQERPRTLRAALDLLRRYQGPLKGTNQDGRMAESFFLSINALLLAKSVADAINSISVNFDGLQKDYGKSLEDIFYTDPPFLYLSEYAKRYGTDYTAFYEDIEKAIATLAKVLPEEEGTPPEQSWKLPLHLMTALRAKGKEFDAVIILDVNRDIWPNKLAASEAQLEQERRVFYVAFTRARKNLLLLVNETILGEKILPSPYLSEMGLQASAIKR